MSRPQPRLELVRLPGAVEMRKVNNDGITVWSLGFIIKVKDSWFRQKFRQCGNKEFITIRLHGFGFSFELQGLGCRVRLRFGFMSGTFKDLRSLSSHSFGFIELWKSSGFRV